MDRSVYTCLLSAASFPFPHYLPQILLIVLLLYVSVSWDCPLLLLVSRYYVWSVSKQLTQLLLVVCPIRTWDLPVQYPSHLVIPPQCMLHPRWNLTPYYLVLNCFRDIFAQSTPLVLSAVSDLCLCGSVAHCSCAAMTTASVLSCRSVATGGTGINQLRCLPVIQSMEGHGLLPSLFITLCTQLTFQPSQFHH